MGLPAQAESGTTINGALFGRTVHELGASMPVTMDMEDSVEEAVNFMLLKQMGCILATDGETLSGILTERDILSKVVGQRSDMSSIKISDVMTANPEFCRETETIAAVLRKMNAGGYRHLPVVDAENHPVGIISVKDIIRFVTENLT